MAGELWVPSTQSPEETTFTPDYIQGQIREASKQFGVPESIALGVGRRESNFHWDSVGGSGEIGPMQLMPNTAKMLGVNPHDVHANIRGGVQHLANLYREFGNWDQALMAYNAGGPAVHSGRIPASTRQYLNEVMNFARTYGWNTQMSPAGPMAGGRPTSLGSMWVPDSPTKQTHPDEARFQKWYGQIVNRRQAVGVPLSSDPYDPRHNYDYYGLYKSGWQVPAQQWDAHFPSRFKTADNPRRIVDGIDTVTGQQVSPYKYTGSLTGFRKLKPTVQQAPPSKDVGGHVKDILQGLGLMTKDVWEDPRTKVATQRLDPNSPEGRAAGQDILSFVGGGEIGMLGHAGEMGMKAIAPRVGEQIAASPLAQLVGRLLPSSVGKLAPTIERGAVQVIEKPEGALGAGPLRLPPGTPTGVQPGVGALPGSRMISGPTTPLGPQPEQLLLPERTGRVWPPQPQVSLTEDDLRGTLQTSLGGPPRLEMPSRGQPLTPGAPTATTMPPGSLWTPQTRAGVPQQLWNPDSSAYVSTTLVPSGRVELAGKAGNPRLLTQTEIGMRAEQGMSLPTIEPLQQLSFEQRMYMARNNPEELSQVVLEEYQARQRKSLVERFGDTPIAGGSREADEVKTSFYRRMHEAVSGFLNPAYNPMLSKTGMLWINAIEGMGEHGMNIANLIRNRFRRSDEIAQPFDDLLASAFKGFGKAPLGARAKYLAESVFRTPKEVPTTPGATSLSNVWAYREGRLDYSKLTEAEKSLQDRMTEYFTLWKNKAEEIAKNIPWRAKDGSIQRGIDLNVLVPGGWLDPEKYTPQALARDVKWGSNKYAKILGDLADRLQSQNDQLSFTEARRLAEHIMNRSVKPLGNLEFERHSLIDPTYRMTAEEELQRYNRGMAEYLSSLETYGYKGDLLKIENQAMRDKMQGDPAFVEAFIATHTGAPRGDPTMANIVNWINSRHYAAHSIMIPLRHAVQAPTALAAMTGKPFMFVRALSRLIADNGQDFARRAGAVLRFVRRDMAEMMGTEGVDMSGAVSQYTGMNWMMRLQSSIAAYGGDEWMKDLIAQARTPGGYTRSMKALTAEGVFDGTDAARILAQGATRGDRYRWAKFVSDTVMLRGPGKLPAWLDHPWARLITMFRVFPIRFGSLLAQTATPYGGQKFGTPWVKSLAAVAILAPILGESLKDAQVMVSGTIVDPRHALTEPGRYLAQRRQREPAQALPYLPSWAKRQLTNFGYIGGLGVIETALEAVEAPTTERAMEAIGGITLGTAGRLAGSLGMMTKEAGKPTPRQPGPRDLPPQHAGSRQLARTILGATVPGISSYFPQAIPELRTPEARRNAIRQKALDSLKRGDRQGFNEANQEYQAFMRWYKQNYRQYPHIQNMPMTLSPSKLQKHQVP